MLVADDSVVVVGVVVVVGIVVSCVSVVLCGLNCCLFMIMCFRVCFLPGCLCGLLFVDPLVICVHGVSVV